MRLYAWAFSMDLRCSQGHEHPVREHCIDSVNWRHLLKEFPEYLFKKDPNEEHIQRTQANSPPELDDELLRD